MRVEMPSTSHSGWNWVAYTFRPTRNICTGHAVDVASSVADGGEPGDGLLVADERRERVGQAGQQRVGGTLGRALHLDHADRLAVGAVDHRALMGAERADPVAGAEEREVARHHLVEQPCDLRLGAALHGGLLLRRIGGVERSAADEDAGVGIEVHVAQGLRFEASALEIALVQPGVAQEQRVLLVGGHVFGAGRQQQEGLHRHESIPPCTAARTVPTPLPERSMLDRARGAP